MNLVASQAWMVYLLGMPETRSLRFHRLGAVFTSIVAVTSDVLTAIVPPLTATEKPVVALTEANVSYVPSQAYFPDRCTMMSATRSASAAMVMDGFRPMALGRTAPSAT